MDSDMEEWLNDAFGLTIPERKRGGRGNNIDLPTKFRPDNLRPNNVRPNDLFYPRPELGLVHTVQWRFISEDRKTALIYTDGACQSNGQTGAKAGWAVYFGPSEQKQMLSGRLEDCGPFGDPAEQTSNRAELRAAIAGLRCIPWAHDGFTRVVVATDSKYMADGITEWMKKWLSNGWRNSEGRAVKNRDLWEVLLGEVERYRELEVDVEFWWIPREWNEVADRGAEAAAMGPDKEEFDDRMVFGC